MQPGFSSAEPGYTLVSGVPQPAPQQPYILRDPDGRVLSRVAKSAPLSWQTRATTERTDYTYAVLFPTYMGASRAAQGQGGTPELLPAEL